MTYKYQIVIKTFKSTLYGSGWYDDTCKFDFEGESCEPVNELIERYGGANNVRLFLEQLIAMFPSPDLPQDQLDEFLNFTHEQLQQEVKNLLSDRESLRIAKQKLEDLVSELSLTKQNLLVETLRSEKAELKRDKERVDKENQKFQSNISRLEKELERLKQQLSSKQTQNDREYQQYQQTDRDYKKLLTDWNKLVPHYNALQKQIDGINQTIQENDKLKKSKQFLENRIQDIQQELQDTQHKLSLATFRLRGVNTHSELGGGGSRSDQLKNEFSHLKTTLHEVSTNVLKSWQSQGFKSTAKNDFRSEEFFRIKSILSQRVFGDGMAYFAKDKTAVDAELHLVMNALQGIKGFSPTAAISQEIQEKIQVGLLRSKGVDHSDEALVKYIEETMCQIKQDLQLVANYETTDEVSGEIKNFVEIGLKLVREVINDPNSGELFIPKKGESFDDNAHDTRDDHQGQVKMTVCAGYRIKATVLVKADVMTCEPEVTSQENEPEPVNPQSSNPENLESEGETRGNDSPNIQKVEEGKETTDLIVGHDDSDDSVFVQPRSSDSSQEHSEGTHEKLDPNEPEKSSAIFTGKVTSTSGVYLRSRPNNQYRTKIVQPHNAVLTFEAWIVGETWDDISKKMDKRWYKLAGQDYWVPADFIEGEPPSDMPPMEYSGGDDEAR